MAKIPDLDEILKNPDDFFIFPEKKEEEDLEKYNPAQFKNKYELLEKTTELSRKKKFGVCFYYLSLILGYENFEDVIITLEDKHPGKKNKKIIFEADTILVMTFVQISVDLPRYLNFDGKGRLFDVEMMKIHSKHYNDYKNLKDKFGTDLKGIDRIILLDQEIIETNNYALGVEEIKKQGLLVPYFVENIEARLQQVEENPGKKLNELRLLNTWLDSNCAILYNGKGKAKIIHNCKELTNIDPKHNSATIQSNYDKYQIDNIDVFEINLKNKKNKYNESLNYEEVINHEGWLALFQNNKELLQKYAKLTLDNLEDNKGMKFWIKQNSREGELRTLCINFMNYNSDAIGSNDLNYIARFAQVTHKE
jgi:hypothetical protein